METLMAIQFQSRVNKNREQWAFAFWILILTLISAIYFLILPVRADSTTAFHNPRFWLETLSWIPAIALSAWLAFRKPPRVPSQDITKFLPLFAPLLLVCIRMHAFAERSGSYIAAGEFSAELDLYRGRCGFIILATGVLTSVIGLSAIRRYVLLNKIEIGGWALFSCGCFGSFLMQFVCAHENPLHLFIWHFVPLMLLGVMALQLEKLFIKSGAQQQNIPRQSTS